MSIRNTLYVPIIYDALKAIGREASLWLSGVIVFALFVAVEAANISLGSLPLFTTKLEPRLGFIGGFFILYVLVHSFAFALFTHSIHTSQASLWANISAACKRLVPLMGFYCGVFILLFISTIPSAFSTMMVMQGHHSVGVFIPFAVSGALIALLLFLLMRYVLFPYIIILENKSIKEALAASATRLQGRKWQVIVTGVIFPLILFGITLYPLRLIPVIGMQLAVTLWVLLGTVVLYLFYRNTAS